MDDDDIFERSMDSLGVEPLDGGVRRRAEGDDAHLEQEDRRLFEQAMRDLGTADGGRSGGGSAVPRAAPKARRLKTRPKHLRPDDELDLHGLKAEEALKRLAHFVGVARASGARTVLVITGKGHNSPGGRGVLRRRVEEWIRGPGRVRVRAWCQAPARLGGGGAFVLYLRGRSG